MFGMSFGEILLIAIIAILFLGPEKLPDAMVKVAKFFKSFKKGIHDAKETIEHEIHLTELKEEALSYKDKLENSVSDFKKDADFSALDELNKSNHEIQDSLNKLDAPKKEKTKKDKDV